MSLLRSHLSKTLSPDQIKLLVAHIRELARSRIDQRGGYGNE